MVARPITKEQPVSGSQWIVAMRFAGQGRPCEYKVFAVEELERAPNGWEIASQTYDNPAAAEALKELLESEDGPDSLGGR